MIGSVNVSTLPGSRGAASPGAPPEEFCGHAALWAGRVSAGTLSGSHAAVFTRENTKYRTAVEVDLMIPNSHW